MSSAQSVTSSLLNFFPARSLSSQLLVQFSHQVVLETNSGVSVMLSPTCVHEGGEGQGGREIERKRERERERERYQ